MREAQLFSHLFDENLDPLVTDGNKIETAKGIQRPYVMMRIKFIFFPKGKPRRHSFHYGNGKYID